MSEPSEGALKFADEALANARRYEPPEEDDFRDAIALVVDAAIQAERARCSAIARAHDVYGEAGTILGKKIADLIDRGVQPPPARSRQ